MPVIRCVTILPFSLQNAWLTVLQLEPVTGQGGNSAIETSAALVNHLVAALNKNRLKPLSTEHLSSIFEKVQQQRQSRVTRLVESAHTSQRIGALDTSAIKFAVRYIVPYLPTSVLENSWVSAYCPAVSLKMLPPSTRPRKIPYHDERPQTLKSSKPTGLAIYTGSISIGSIVLLFLAFRHLFTIASLIQVQAFLE